jgi:hypothetical protein
MVHPLQDHFYLNKWLIKITKFLQEMLVAFRPTACRSGSLATTNSAIHTILGFVLGFAFFPDNINVKNLATLENFLFRSLSDHCCARVGFYFRIFVMFC